MKVIQISFLIFFVFILIWPALVRLSETTNTYTAPITSGNTSLVQLEKMEASKGTMPDTRSAGIYGNESRTALKMVSPGYPERTTGKFIGLGTCSGTLIGPCYVLSARHCFVGIPENAAKVFMSTDPTNGHRNSFFSNYNVVLKGNDDSPNEDFALIKLNERIGEKLGWMALEKASPASIMGRKMEVIGYSRDCIGDYGCHQTYGVRDSYRRAAARLIENTDKSLSQRLLGWRGQHRMQ